MIVLQELLINCSKYIHAYNAWCFVGSEYPAFFFTQFRAHVEQITGLQWHSLSPSGMSLNELAHHLSISFLGERRIYFLGNLAAVDNAIISWCHAYEGPHLIIYQSTQTTQKSGTLQIVLPHPVTPADYASLMPLLFKGNADSAFFHEVNKHIKQIDLDTACSLMFYQTLLGKRHQEFVQEWLPKIIPSAASLFTLATHFFARDKEQFFKSWQTISPQFAEEFWVSYWSEQLWQASLFMTQANAIGSEKASKMTNRLPFSFVQRDWKKYSLDQIATAHQNLLRIDTQLKNGATSLQIETWLLKWLNNK